MRFSIHDALSDRLGHALGGFAMGKQRAGFFRRSNAGAGGGSDLAAPLTLTAEAKDEIVRTKATCPFLGSAVNQGVLPVRGAADNPLASIDDVQRLGNSGGGDLGDLLVLFAAGNHARMRGDTGMLDRKVPNGLFSLELPGSQGSHPGHSGILQGDPAVLGSGRVSQEDFARLANRASDGFIKRSDVGRFIAENLAKDPKSKVSLESVAELFASDTSALLESAGHALMEKLLGSDEDTDAAHRDFKEKLTKLLGEDNLIGSAGEFALLFAFLGRRPDAREIDGEPALSLQDLRDMFLDKRFPVGWEAWRKLEVDWLKHATALAFSAAKEYHALT